MPKVSPSMTVRVSHKAVRPEHPTKVFLAIDLIASAQANVEGEPTDIILVLDTSRSMHGAGVKAIRQSLESWWRRLRPDDRLAIVGFGSFPTTLLPLTPVSQIDEKMHTALSEELRPDGATAMHAALLEAAGLVSGNVQARNLRFVLVTDGKPSDVEKAEGFAGVAAQLKGLGGVVDCLGIGEEYNENVLSTLVDFTGGLWSHAADPEALTRLVDYHAKLATQVVDAAQDLRIVTASGVSVEGIYEYRPAIRQLPLNAKGKDHAVSVPPLSSGEKRTIVIALNVSPDEPGSFPLANLTLGRDTPRKLVLECDENATELGDDAVPRGLYEISRTQVLAMSPSPANRKAAAAALDKLEADPALARLSEVRDRIDRSRTIVKSPDATREQIHRAKTVVRTD